MPSESRRSGAFEPPAADGVARACGIAMLVGVAVMGGICLAVQFLRTDLDWITTTLSMYVMGPYGRAVQVSLIVPVPGMAALGVGWYRTLGRGPGNLAALVLFVVAAVALCVTALNLADASAWPHTLHGKIHQWAAFSMFLCVISAMVVNACQLRRHRHWRKYFAPALALAVAIAVYFCIYALFRAIPRGIGEKALIAMALAWLWRSGWHLARAR